MSRPVIVSKAAAGALQQVVQIGPHSFAADVAESLGGSDAGPDPHDFLDTALAACTALTVTMVARRKQIPLEDMKVTVTHVEADGLYTLARSIEFIGGLSDEQKQYLLGIADKCPIHKALSGRFAIETTAL